VISEIYNANFDSKTIFTLFNTFTFLVHFPAAQSRFGLVLSLMTLYSKSLQICVLPWSHCVEETPIVLSVVPLTRPWGKKDLHMDYIGSVDYCLQSEL
jgi:hypothetical protein